MRSTGMLSARKKLLLSRAYKACLGGHTKDAEDLMGQVYGKAGASLSPVLRFEVLGILRCIYDANLLLARKKIFDMMVQSDAETA